MRQHQSLLRLLRSVVQEFRHNNDRCSVTRMVETAPLDCLRPNINAARYGEVRESGLIGATRNHVCPCGTEGSNPSLSAIPQVQKGDHGGRSYKLIGPAPGPWPVRLWRSAREFGPG